MNKPIFIAEVGVNHNGRISLAKKLISIASKAGADYVGNLVDVGEEDITLEWSSREPKTVGKGKITVVKNKLI